MYEEKQDNHESKTFVASRNRITDRRLDPRPGRLLLRREQLVLLAAKPKSTLPSSSEAVLSSGEKGTLQGSISGRRVVLLLIFPLLPFLQLLLLLLLQLELSALVLRGEDRRSALGFGRQRLFGDRRRDVPFFLVDRSKD